MILNLPFVFAILTLVCAVGLVMFAYYEQCDPVKFKIIKKSDQVFYFEKRQFDMYVDIGVANFCALYEQRRTVCNKIS